MMDAVALLGAGQVEAAAGSRANLLGIAAQVPGSRVLADPVRRPGAADRPPARPLGGRPGAGVGRARQALASGLIRTSIARSGTVGVQPAAAGAPGGLPRTGGPPPSPSGVALMAPVLGARRAVAQTMTRIVPAVT